MKTKDNIEELITNNLDGLNEMEPADGHFERFEAKLKAQQKKKTITLRLVWKVAAAVVFVLLAVNQAAIYFSPDGKGLIPTKGNSEVTLASISPEYREVEFYFTNSINVSLEQWNQLKNEGAISEEEQNLMDNELLEFDRLHQSLQKDLTANPNDERVINAMLEYYQSKLHVISMIVDKLQEVQRLKAEKHDESEKSI